SCRRTSKEARKPEADAAFVGFRSVGEERQCNRAANERRRNCLFSVNAVRVDFRRSNLLRHEPPPLATPRAGDDNEGELYDTLQLNFCCALFATMCKLAL